MNELKMKLRPHVVILGAGASCATILNGDKNGHYISAMDGFIEKLGLTPILENVSIKTKSYNFEDIYMELNEKSFLDKKFKEVKGKLEDAIRKYFLEYELPDKPTIYDYLLLSLTSKDLVATFNWDPLLMQAYEKVSQITKNLPHLAFLHGNVAIAYCKKDYNLGFPGYNCKCGEKLIPVDLLYPIKDKKYTLDPFIKNEWEIFKDYMKRAYMITIFGYSAPKSDIAAIEIMKEVWGTNNERNMEQIEIIDLRKEDEVLESWHDFIHTHHYSYKNDFFETTLGCYPRRSCEVTFDRVMNLKRFNKSNGFKNDMNLDQIKNFLKPLLDDEVTNYDNDKMLTNLYL